jgi:hypothetical protein
MIRWFRRGGSTRIWLFNPSSRVRCRDRDFLDFGVTAKNEYVWQTSLFKKPYQAEKLNVSTTEMSLIRKLLSFSDWTLRVDVDNRWMTDYHDEKVRIRRFSG